VSRARRTAAGTLAAPAAKADAAPRTDRERLDAEARRLMPALRLDTASERECALALIAACGFNVNACAPGASNPAAIAQRSDAYVTAFALSCAPHADPTATRGDGADTLHLDGAAVHTDDAPLPEEVAAAAQERETWIRGRVKDGTEAERKRLDAQFDVIAEQRTERNRARKAGR